jgi:exodeoxyribonuclease-1
LIDVVRTAYALRPEGIVWPEEEGRVTLKLERLTAANGIDHGHAHDALSDVRATIALARLVRDKQPKLYDYLFGLRFKHKVQDQIRLMQPLVHISGRFSAARSYVSVVLPLAWHPVNRNALIVCDLFHDHSPLLEEDGETLRQRLYTRREDLLEGQLPVPLKLLHVNKCPVIAPLSVLREEDRQRLQLDMSVYKTRVAALNEGQTIWQDKLKSVYANDNFAASEDPEQQLYDGFINDRDRRLCEQVRLAEPQQLATDGWPFDDPRLPELLFRYRARNFAETLNVAEQQRWLAFCQLRLSDPQAGAPNTFKAFSRALIELSLKATPEQLKVLAQWQEYSLVLKQRLGL